MFAFVVLLQLAWLLAPTAVLAFPADTNGLGLADRARTHYEEAQAQLSKLDTVHDIKRSFDTSDHPQPPEKRSPPLTPRQDKLETVDKNVTFALSNKLGDGSIATQNDKIATPNPPTTPGDYFPIHWHKGPFSLDGYINLDNFDLDVVFTLFGRKAGEIDCNLEKECKLDINLWFAKGYVSLYIRYKNQLWLHVDLKVAAKHIVEDYYVLTFAKQRNAVGVAGNLSMTS